MFGTALGLGLTAFGPLSSTWADSSAPTCTAFGRPLLAAACVAAAVAILACTCLLAGCATPLTTYKPADNQIVMYNQGVGTIFDDTPEFSLLMYPTF